MPPTDLAVFEILRKHGVPFVIIGGHAVNFHGFPRATEDSDVVWLRSNESEQALLGALEELQASYIGNKIDPATGIEELRPVTLGYVQVHHLMMLVTRIGFLDLFDYIPGFPEEDPRQLLDTSMQADGLRYASLEWLKKMKTAAGRTKDQTDLENLP